MAEHKKHSKRSCMTMFHGPRTYRYQRQAGKVVGPIENLKNRLADNEVPPIQFYIRYVKPICNKTYNEFLLDLNWYDVWTSYIKRAAEEFKKDSR